MLDPFAGIGTVGRASVKLGRRFVLIDKNPEYVEIMKSEAKKWMGQKAKDILTINSQEIDVSDILL